MPDAAENIDPQLGPAVAAESPGPARLILRRFRRQRVAIAGGVILAVLYAAAIFAGFIAPYSYERQDRERFFHQPTALTFAHGWPAVAKYETAPGEVNKYQRVPGESVPLHFFVHGASYQLLGFIPCSVHLFGTEDPQNPVYLMGADSSGRDTFSRVLYGSQISLSIGLVGIVLTYGLGMLVGGFAGYFGGAVDTGMMRICELVMSIPALYLIMSLRATFPPTLSSTKVYLMIVVIMSFIGWAGAARVIRGMVLSLRERPYVMAAQVLGQSNWNIVVRHILPGTFSYVIVGATLKVPYYILGEVVLSFLGVGIQEPDASWGNMLTAAQNPDYLLKYPWLLAPGIAIFITVLAFNFLGDGLRDALDAKSD